MKKFLTIMLGVSMVLSLFDATACSPNYTSLSPPTSTAKSTDQSSSPRQSLANQSPTAPISLSDDKSPSVPKLTATSQSSPITTPVFSPTKPIATPVSPTDTPTVTEFGSPPSAIQMHVCDQVVFSLESNPSTGYKWQMATGTNENVVKLYKQEFIQPRATITPPPVGVPGVEKFTFTATGQGQTTITLNYVRSWEKDIAPAKTQVINVTVSPITTPAPMVIHVGEQLVFGLEANPSTGYAWQIAPGIDENVVKVSSQGYIQPPTPTTTPPPVGVPVTEKFLFVGIAQGQTTVTLNYVRPWEKDGAPVKTQVFNVIVK